MDAIDAGIGATAAIPGAGTVISSVLGIGKGVFDLIKSNREQKKAQGLRPPMEDPEMRGHLQYLERKRRAIESGAIYGRQSAEIDSQLANTQSGIIQASGGNAGAAILGMTRAQRGAGDAFGNLVDSSMPLQIGLENNIGNVLNNISQRKADLQLYDYTTALGESAQYRKAGEEAIMGGAARLLPMAFQKGSGSNPRTNPVSLLPARTVNGGGYTPPTDADLSTSGYDVTDNLLKRTPLIPMEAY